MRRFEIDESGLYNVIRQVKKGCLVCNGDNQNDKEEATWTPIIDQPMESVAMDIFSMPKVHIGKQVFDCVALCVEEHSCGRTSPQKGIVSQGICNHDD